MQELTIPLDSTSKVPLYEQIYRFITSEIHDGRLAEGARLPSKRALCAHLGVSLSTVEGAYSLLLAEGYISSRPRSGFYVSAAALPRAIHRPTAPADCAPQNAPLRFDTSTAAVDTSAFPYATWAKIFKQVLYERPDLLQRGEAQGDRELREALSAFLYQYRGVRCRPEQVVVGAGMEHLIEVILHLMPSATSVALEDPGYTAVARLIEGHGHIVRPVPVDGGGMNPDALRTCDARIVYITPAHQFPTGALMPVSRRMQLLAWADEQHDRLIIEDDYDSEFRYSSRPIPALQGLAHAENVVYAGTFSRTVAPSIRIAYMVLPEKLLALYRARYARSASPVSRFEQQTMARFLQGGWYARHLRRVGNLYRTRCAALSEALSKIDGVRVSANDGGLHLLITHDRLTEQEMLDRAARYGILLHGLSEYRHSAQISPSTVVAGFAALSPQQIPELAALLEKAWTESE